MKTKEKREKGYWASVLTKEFIEEQYSLGKRDRDINEELGCPTGILNRYKRLYGIPISKRKKREYWPTVLTKEFILSRCVPNKCDKEIAKEIGCSYPTFRKYKKIHNIPTTKHLNGLAQVGKKYGKLTVLEIDYDNKQHISLKCKCDCGIEKSIRNNRLLSGVTKSCGCLQRVCGKHRGSWRGYGDISMDRFCSIKTSANRRNISFNITIEDAWELFLKQNKKCNLSGLDIYFPKRASGYFTASLDRIDSSRGYEINNIQFLHKDVNKIKLDFSQDYFIEICKLISNNYEKPFSMYKQNNIYNKLHSTYWLRIRDSANIRNLQFDVTKEYLENLFQDQRGKCYLSKQTLNLGKRARDDQTASIDRIDNSKGYILDNLAFSHKDINKMKWTYSVDYFVSLCKLIDKHNE